MAAKGSEALVGAHTLVLSARSVTLKMQSGLEVRCGKQEWRKGEEERKELATQENTIKALMCSCIIAQGSPVLCTINMP